MLRRILKRLNSSSSARNQQTKRRPRLSTEALESRIVLTAGTATLSGGILTICGTAAADRVIVAELANDYFVHGTFLSENMFFAKSDVSSIVIEGGDGNDTLLATSLTTGITMRGQAGNDRLFGGLGADTLEGNAGDDLIYGNQGGDTIRGDDGIDTVFAGDGNDLIFGGLGDDTLIGMAGDDTIRGNEGDDKPSGGGGKDTIFGNEGEDQLLGGAGDDMLFGGADDDVLVGDGDHDELFGEDGDDLLLGAGGNDRIFGGNGGDRIVGSLGDDFLSGGDGIDDIFGDDGSDQIHGGAGNDELYAGKGLDTLFGNAGDDTMRGGNGDDVLVGHGGADTLFAGDGKDILIGGADADVLLGEGNQDFLVSGATNHQNDQDALDEARQMWLSADNFQIRVSDLLGGLVVDNPGVGDVITGGNGQDSFYPAAGSEVTDEQSNEPIIGEDLVAVSDLFFASIGETITTTLADGVLANDMVTSGGTPQASGVLQFPAHGSLSPGASGGLDGDFEFTMEEHGRDFFIYELSDGSGQTWQARARIEVPNLPLLPDGVTLTETASGLQFYDFEVGSGSTPGPTSNVLVDYIGYLPNGNIFDQNMNISFPLQNLIDGFSEGTQGMQPGGRRRIVIPPELGYGAGGNSGAGIGGTDTIIFDVTLHSFT